MLSQAHYEQAQRAYASGNFEQAISLCDQLLSERGKNDNLLNLKAMACLFNGQPEDAENAIRRALKLSPRCAGFHLNAGRIYHHLSRNKLVKRHAQEALERAVSLLPGNTRALSVLVKLRRDGLADTQTVQLLEEARHRAPNDSDRVTATFALADMHRRENSYDEAFELYREANDLVSRSNSFDIDAWEQQLAMMEKISSESGDFAPRQSTAGSNLVFIVGMPRSGTSLCEQVLSAHTGVLACGELGTMANIEAGFERKSVNPYLLKSVNRERPAKLDTAASLYLSCLPGDYQDYQLVVDKAPMNFIRIGLIHQIFPAARFVYCTRQPLDTILSCYIQNFQGGLSFASKLDHIVRVYIAHTRVMQHWSNLLPQLIHTVNYEAMVTDLETEANASADFLGLEFETSMLSPHKQKRTVMTLSNLQVRKPVYSSSINNWKNYRHQLSQVIQFLNSKNN